MGFVLNLFINNELGHPVQNVCRKVVRNLTELRKSWKRLLTSPKDLPCILETSNDVSQFPKYSSNFKAHFWTLDLVFSIFRGVLFQMLERNSK